MAKSLVEHGLAAARVPAVLRTLRRDSVVVLAYHNIVPDGAPAGGDESLHLPKQKFARQMDLLLETHRIVPLADAFREPFGQGTRPRAVVTFDDGYRGALTAGLDVLEDRGIPATAFVCPGLLAREGLWWDELLGGENGSSGLLREEALQGQRGEEARIAAWAHRLNLTRVSQPAHAGVVTEEELRVAAETPGITVAPHSWSHPNLARLPTREMRHEISRPLEWLRARFPATVPWLAYPYGQFDQRVEHEARVVGYQGTLRVSGGCIKDPPAGHFSLPRLNVSKGLSREGFALRTAGL